MTIRFASLGSGSRGNGTVIQAGDTLVLVDCGFSLSETKRRLARLGLEPQTLTAVLVTHEHSDHISGVMRLAARYRLPVWGSRGTCRKWLQQRASEVAINCFDSHEGFALDGLAVEPLTVPHDAVEPTQFVFSDGQFRIGLLTDTGRITPFLLEALAGVHALFLEANHDEQLLHHGAYPPPLKQRIGGPFGHLSNRQAARLLGQLDRRALQHLVLGHLSEHNNTPDLVRRTIAEVMESEPEEVEIAGQSDGIGWRELRGARRFI